jgi:hypothetical protein
MNPDPIQNAVRAARRARRLGPNANCADCGLSDLHCLEVVTAAGALPAGDRGVRCGNCRLKEAAQREGRVLLPIPGVECKLCSETARECLERHHLAGRANLPELTGWLCCNCHREQTWRLADLGQQLREKAPSVPEQVINFLLGTGEFLIELGGHMVDLAADLRRWTEDANEHASDSLHVPETD